MRTSFYTAKNNYRKSTGYYHGGYEKWEDDIIEQI